MIRYWGMAVCWLTSFTDISNKNSSCHIRRLLIRKFLEILYLFQNLIINKTIVGWDF